ncbi:mitochondrial import inner membrane translocase subunit Tim13p [[Candida] jaroonii]|uniref:Mitochondrial import inner membrane translocase subunit Tim13p n=1 Tax=[Candida] jaroonii TaxID=467808 RepID=A0ACA9YFV6_9ASCO|nr:mitochondrial import inner membrane translocase subunit Tim13p [[Candida] jaroonii]
MALFGSSSPQITTQSDLKTQIQNDITQELAVANASELINKVTENCFEHCIQVPENILTPQQDNCANQCLARYMKSWNVISKTYVNRIQNSK